MEIWDIVATSLCAGFGIRLGWGIAEACIDYGHAFCHSFKRGYNREKNKKK